jgi:hypothetical protein
VRQAVSQGRHPDNDRTGMSIRPVGSAGFIFVAIWAKMPFRIVFFLCAYTGINGFCAANMRIPLGLTPGGQADEPRRKRENRISHFRLEMALEAWDFSCPRSRFAAVVQASRRRFCADRTMQ